MSDNLDEINALEKLLGMPQGSTKSLNADEVVPALVEGIENKTKDLADKADKISNIQKMDPQDKIKSGITEEQLDTYRQEVIDDAVKVKNISMKLLEKMKKDIEDKIVVTPQLWAAAPAMLSSVMGNISKIGELVARYRQEEEMKRLTTVSQETTEDGKIELSPVNLSKLISEHKQRMGKPSNIKATDAEIVDPQKPESEV